jgi:hypothetical protein
VDAVACDRLAEPVEKDGFMGRTVADEGDQCVDGRCPERAATYLAALASELHGTELVGTQAQVANQQRRGLGDASARVIENNKSA